MAENPPEEPEPGSPEERPDPPRRPRPIERAKPGPPIEDHLARLAASFDRLASRREHPDEGQPDPDDPAIPPKVRRLTRSGTINGDETLNELLQGGNPPPPAGAELPANGGATPPARAPEGAALASSPPPPDPHPTPAGAREPRIPAALHRRKLKLLIVGGQLFGLTLLVLGLGLGWLLFGAHTAPPTAESAVHPEAPAPTSARDASEPTLAAADAALKVERDGDLPGALRLYETMARDSQNLRGLKYRRAVVALRRGDLTAADLLLARSIEDGDSVAACAYVRSTFAGSKGDYASVISSLQQAARAEPFSSRVFFYWAEALRRDGHPLAAIDRFDEALERPCSPTEAEYIRFKQNLARIETGNATELTAGITEHLREPAVSGEWLLLAAADDLTRGAYSAGADHLRRAAQALPPAGFSEKLADYLFQTQSQRPEFAPIFAAAKAKLLQTNPPGGAPAAGEPFTDPAAWTIQEADPAAWPSPTVVLPH